MPKARFRAHLKPGQWLIVRTDLKSLANKLEVARQLEARGWQITVLLAPDKKSIVILGCRRKAPGKSGN